MPWLKENKTPERSLVVMKHRFSDIAAGYYKLKCSFGPGSVAQSLML
jgi:hypothetical protein